MNAATAKRLRKECEEAIRLDPRISMSKLWKAVSRNYNATPAKQRATFSIFEGDSKRE